MERKFVCSFFKFVAVKTAVYEDKSLPLIEERDVRLSK
jgi:hypothetical protein